MTTSNKTVTIKILNEIKCVIIGLRREEYHFFFEKYGMFTKGYQFQIQYKLRRWDGKTRFFNENGLTYIHLLDEIVPLIKDMGYGFKLIDKRTSSAFYMPEIDETYFQEFGITLAPHQVGAINAIAAAGNGIILAGTGAGKSIATAAICDLATKHNGAKNVVIVPNKDLITQTRLEIQQFGIKVGEYSGSNKDVSGDTVVSTWQALQNNPTILSLFNSIIVDECHGVTGKVLKGLLEEHAGHIGFRIALTGTLQEDDTDLMTMRCILGTVLHTTLASELIDNGWLASLNIKQRCLVESFAKEYAEYLDTPLKEGQKRLKLKQFIDSYLPDYEAERAFLGNRRIRNEFIADLIYGLSIKPKGNTFVMVKNVAQGKKLASMIEGAVFVYGADKSKVRKKIYDAFAENDNLVVISTYQLASTGLNIKRMFHMVMIDAGKSFTSVIQTIGRSLRKAHDKEEVTVYDLYSNIKYSRRHAKKRKEFYEEQGYAVTDQPMDYMKLYNEIE